MIENVPWNCRKTYHELWGVFDRFNRPVAAFMLESQAKAVVALINAQNSPEILIVPAQGVVSGAGVSPG